MLAVVTTQGIPLSTVLDEIGAAIAIVGSIVTVIKSLAERSQSRSSLISKRDEEIDQVGKLAGCYLQVGQANLTSEHTQLLQEQIQSRLQESVATIQQLNLKLSTAAKDPAWDFGFWKKFFLWFKPKGWRAIALHVLAYASPITALIFLVLSLVRSKGHALTNAIHHEDHAAGYAIWTAIALVYAFVFHFWALDELRRQEGYRKTPGIVSRLLLIQAPETFRMLLAQLLFFFGATLSIALLGHIVRHWSKQDSLVNFLSVFGLLMLGLYTSIFRGWAVAEHDYWEYRPELKSSFHAMFRGLFRNIRQSGWPKLRLIFAGALTSIVGLACLLISGSLMLDGSLSEGALVALAGLLFVLTTFYPASRAVRIRYALAEKATVATAAAGLH